MALFFCFYQGVGDGLQTAAFPHGCPVLSNYFFVWESKISEFTKITIDNSNFL